MTYATTISRRLADFVVSQREGQMDDSVRRDIRRRVRDLVGVSLAAADTEPAEIIARLVTSSGGTEQAGLIGRTGRYPAALAALYNGTLAHALDFDDTHLPSVLHPSASVIPAALAAAEAAGSSGAKFVRAVAIGEEICIRLGMAAYDVQARDSVFFENGLHATSICGTVGAAAAAAAVFGLDANAIAHALAISSSFGAGLLEANRTGGSVKRVHCGWAAHAGIIAAEMSRCGLTGAPTAFEGRFGFFRAFCGGRADLKVVTSGLGTEWELQRVFFKPYPTNHFTHAGIDAALALRARGVRPDDVAAVELGVPRNVLRTIAEPAEEKARPPTGYTARFSGPFTFATALIGGSGLGVHLDDFTDDGVNERRRLELAARVRCVADPVCDEIFPVELPTIARVRTRHGEELVVEILHNRGGPSNPLSDAELETKFTLNASRALPGDRVTLLDQAIARIEQLGRLTELLELAHP